MWPGPTLFSILPASLFSRFRKKKCHPLFFNGLSIILPCQFGSCGNLNPQLSFFPLHLWRELGHTCVRALVFSLAFLVCSWVFLCWCALFFHSLDDSLWHSEVLNKNSFICGCWILLTGLCLHPQVLVPSIFFMSEVWLTDSSPLPLFLYHIPLPLLIWNSGLMDSFVLWMSG